MTTIYISRNQYAIRHGKHRFMCCLVGDVWELTDQTQGYQTVRTFLPDDGELPPEWVEKWIEENYEI